MLYAENIVFLCGLDPDAEAGDSAQKNKSKQGKTQSTPTGVENDGSGKNSNNKAPSWGWLQTRTVGGLNGNQTTHVVHRGANIIIQSQNSVRSLSLKASDEVIWNRCALTETRIRCAEVEASGKWRPPRAV